MALLGDPLGLLANFMVGLHANDQLEQYIIFDNLGSFLVFYPSDERQTLFSISQFLAPYQPGRAAKHFQAHSTSLHANLDRSARFLVRSARILVRLDIFSRDSPSHFKIGRFVLPWPTRRNRAMWFDQLPMPSRRASFLPRDDGGMIQRNHRTSKDSVCANCSILHGFKIVFV